jgi:hypothetical protein
MRCSRIARAAGERVRRVKWAMGEEGIVVFQIKESDHSMNSVFWKDFVCGPNVLLPGAALSVGQPITNLRPTALSNVALAACSETAQV